MAGFALIAALVAFMLLPASVCRAQAAEPCGSAIAGIERASGVPDRLMQAIAIVESGRRGPGGVAAWPWTINVEGVGEVFETKAQAIAAVTAHRAQGARSIDVGCMQINLMHHPDAFASLDEAFDPVVNARYAARFLQRLLVQTGSWPLAVAGYHSLTPEIGADYARKVLAIWARPEVRSGQGSTPQAMADRLSAPSGPAATASLPAPARLVGPAGSPLPMLTNRTLDSYRALPTQVATSAPVKQP